MKQIITQRYVLKVNRYQKSYIRKHLYTTRRIYISLCQTLMHEMDTHKQRTKKEMKGLCRQYHRYYMNVMDDQEVDVMVNALMKYQNQLYQHSTNQVPTYYACIITSRELLWRSISLQSMLHPTTHYPMNSFLYGRLYESHHQLHVDIRIANIVGSLQK